VVELKAKINAPRWALRAPVVCRRFYRELRKRSRKVGEGRSWGMRSPSRDDSLRISPSLRETIELPWGERMTGMGKTVTVMAEN